MFSVPRPVTPRLADPSGSARPRRRRVLATALAIALVTSGGVITAAGPASAYTWTQSGTPSATTIYPMSVSAGPASSPTARILSAPVVVARSTLPAGSLTTQHIAVDYAVQYASAGEWKTARTISYSYYVQGGQGLTISNSLGLWPRGNYYRMIVTVRWLTDTVTYNGQTDYFGTPIGVVTTRETGRYVFTPNRAADFACYVGSCTPGPGYVTVA